MTKTDSNPSSPVNEPLTMTSTDKSEPTTEFILDDVELLSILASVVGQHQNHTDNHFQIPTVAILDWEDWNQDVPEFVNANKRKRNGDDLIDSDDDEDEFNFLDQFDFVDASFDHPLLTESNKKQKINSNSNFVDENADDLSALLKQSDSLMAELDCGWVFDIIS